jgi:hypothetical protein
MENTEMGDSEFAEFEFADLVPFPQKLFTILQKESPSIISWIPSGNAFRIWDSEKFQAEVIPKYFKHTKVASFQRQLNLYGFRRVTKGEAQGAYVHPKFQSMRPENVADIRRLPGKSYSKSQKAAAAAAAASNNGATQLSTSESSTASDESLKSVKRSAVSAVPEFTLLKKPVNSTTEPVLTSYWDSGLPIDNDRNLSALEFDFFENIDWTFEYDAEGVI